jgi:hypothetical protein
LWAMVCWARFLGVIISGVVILGFQKMVGCVQCFEAA